MHYKSFNVLLKEHFFLIFLNSLDVTTLLILLMFFKDQKADVIRKVFPEFCIVQTGLSDFQVQLSSACLMPSPTVAKSAFRKYRILILISIFN